MLPNNDKDRTYAVSYVPKVAGLHKVSPPPTPPGPPLAPHSIPILGPPSQLTAHPKAPAALLPPSLALLFPFTPSQICSSLEANL